MFVIIFIITLLILVISHEFGHFIAAKKFGIKVLEFGFGIPPKIWSKRVGGTVVSINALPIGGFVRLLGEDETDEETLNDPRSFASAKVSKRMVVVAAGVIMNLIFAWALFYIILIYQNFRIIYPTTDNVVTVARVEDNFPAAQAGVKEGERFLKFNGQPISSLEELIKQIKARPNQPLSFEVSDIDGLNTRQVIINPKEVRPGEGLIGVAFSPIPFKTYSTPVQKLFSGVTYSWDLTRLTLAGLGKLITQVSRGEYSQASQNVSGPVGLVSVSKNILSLGADALMPYLWFVAVISLTLAIFNSLPVPALDGGRFIFLLWEFVTRRRVHPGFERWVHTVGMGILLILVALVTFSDIKKLL